MKKVVGVVFLISFAPLLAELLKHVYLFGSTAVRKSIAKTALRLGNQKLKLASVLLSSIVGSQHPFFFMPTTEKQILV
ncbi:MAG: hypothetical protein HKP38_02770 [Croceitalea sp.]|nr:hypothetical protein [Croceitalea sp.]MBT8237743.1 hypothetical protein [Croceitalea sp.]NNC35342.1 hypothetical protein [Croceitalea sp.]NNL08124.1 hypothetical protein [Croceitalea sp.]NNM18775.1 hypothetical protein [Croceitalea sp.]